MTPIPKVKLVYDRRKVSSETHLGTVEVVLTCNDQRSYFSTKVRVLPHQFKVKYMRR